LNIDAFAIGFDHRDRERLHALWDEAMDNEQWSDGPLTHAFEAAWASWNGLPAISTSSWTGAALAAFEYFELRGRTVLCPSNTFMATPLALQAAGASVQFHPMKRSGEDVEGSWPPLARTCR
jgi:dTDP-4-amino-4,6-dideoxygalactose transaminase